jgi:hypothetical protein
MKKCPKCGVLSSDEAALCDCGFRFDSGAVSASSKRGAGGRRIVLTAGVVVALALLLSVALRSSVAWGPSGCQARVGGPGTNASVGFNPMGASGPEQWVVNGVASSVAATYYLALGPGQLQFTIEVPVAEIPDTEAAALAVAWPYIRHAFEQKLYQRTSIKNVGEGSVQPSRIGVALFHKEGANTRGMRVALSMDEIRQRVVDEGNNGAAR